MKSPKITMKSRWKSLFCTAMEGGHLRSMRLDSKALRQFDVWAHQLPMLAESVEISDGPCGGWKLLEDHEKLEIFFSGGLEFFDMKGDVIIMPK